MLSVHSTFALIAPVFLFLLGVAQLGVWGFWRRQAPLLGQGVAFVAASMGMLVQILGWKEPFWSRVLAFSSCYVLAAAAMAVALALRLCPSAQALQAAMQSADKCLYAAKRGGRNQVVDDGQLLPDMPPSAMPAVPKACLSA